MNLTREIIQKSKKYKTPFLLFDLNKVVKNYKTIKQSIKDVEVFYAMKANDHPQILKVLDQCGSSFEVSSLNETRTLIKLGVNPEKIICLNSIKNPEFLQEMHKLGIRIMAYDSIDEVDKIAKYAPKSQLVLRITVDNEGSDWPLTKKFGVSATEALPLLKYAKSKGLEPMGLTFHVGSQCTNKNNWASALYLCDDIWNKAKNEGIYLNFLSLGGGIPIKHLKKIPSIEEIGDVINPIIEKNFKTPSGKARVTVEPGRGLVGDAAILITSVVGKAKRGEENWIYIDVGVFNGLMETVEQFKYELKVEKNTKKKMVTIGGPSCDSVDIPFNSIMLPVVELGDRIYIMNAGAYTTVYAANFNGFEIPNVYFLK